MDDKTAQDEAGQSAGQSQEPLPVWNLADLYPGPESPELAADFSSAEAESRDFEQAYKDKLADLAGPTFGRAIAAYERIDEKLARAGSYAQLLFACDMATPETARFYQSVQERVTDISTRTLFFTLEINRLDDSVLAALLKAPEAARYAAWIRDIRLYRPHQLSDEAEKLLHEKQVAGRAAWTRLFDETMAALRFPVDGKELIETEVLHLLSDKDEATRKKAALSLGHVLGGNARIFALVTNTLAKDKEIEDRWRRFPDPVASRNLSNRVEDEVVTALVSAVKSAYPRLSHRYYALKARWFGKDALEYWDRNAPLPEDDDRRVPWDEAKATVLGAYAGFSPDMAGIGQNFFERAWIDAGPRPGKASGAFSHPTVPSAHPYILLNYQGKTRDVMTLAHELGHGVHQVLAGPQGHLLADTPLTLAETASVFGEMLTFRAILAETTDPVQRKAML
ncbi:MAG TPA: M3 family metallopeptidase, partial [Alphaproteobacteria bacterium]|nr:M3 family metallopeptidase [Alphaproteobacteria bacterium]